MDDKRTKGYHNLLVWQRIKELLILVYRLTEKLPKSEEFGLKPQMRRATVSVISNFVEGYLKSSKKEKIHYMEISGTSLMELEAQGEVCLILEYWNGDNYQEFEKKRGEVGYLLYQYKSKILI